MKTLIVRIIAPFLLVFFASIILASVCSQKVFADGGAPNLAYVANTAQGISVIDIAQQKVTTTISVPGQPHMILLSVDGRSLYVTQPVQHTVTIIAAQSKQVICTAHVTGQPTLLTLDPGTNTLYAAGSQTDTVSAIDPTNCAIKYSVHAPGSVYGLAVAVVGTGISGGNGNQLWVASTSSLSAFDSTGKQLLTLPVPEGPEYITIPSGPTIYVTTRDGSVRAVDLSTRRISPALITGGIFGPMDYDATTGEIYVPDSQHHQLDVLVPVNASSSELPHEPRQLIHLSSAPASIAITSDGQFGFVALSNGDVVMLDIPGRQIINTFHVGGSPAFIITGLYPAAISLTPQQATILSILENSAHYIAAIVIVLVAVILILRERRLRKKRTK